MPWALSLKTCPLQGTEGAGEAMPSGVPAWLEVASESAGEARPPASPPGYRGGGVDAREGAPALPVPAVPPPPVSVCALPAVSSGGGCVVRFRKMRRRVAMPMRLSSRGCSSMYSVRRI